MNILIAGCNGQLGKEIQQLEPADATNTFFNADTKELDVTDEAAVAHFINEHSIDGIVNCAAYTAVDKAENDVPACMAVNAMAPAYLAAAVQKRGGFIILPSTDYVFNGKKSTPYTEEDLPEALNVYGSTKLQGELAAQQNCSRTMILRTAWLYSTYGNNFVKTMIRLGKERAELSVVFDQIGTPTYAKGLAKTIMHILKKGINPGIYNYSDEGAASWYDFTKAIHRLAGINTCTVNPIHTGEYPTLAKRPHYSVLDKSKLKQTYAITIPHWEDHLAECISTLKAEIV